MSDAAGRAGAVERDERLDDEIDSRIVGAVHLAGITVPFDGHTRTDTEDPVRRPGFAGLGELCEHHDADFQLSSSPREMPSPRVDRG